MMDLANAVFVQSTRIVDAPQGNYVSLAHGPMLCLPIHTRQCIGVLPGLHVLVPLRRHRAVVQKGILVHYAVNACQVITKCPPLVPV